MDERTRFMRMLRGEFSNLLGNARIKVVTVVSVDPVLRTAVVNFAQPDPTQDAPDPQTVPYMGHYRPDVGDLAYLGLIEGAPILLGSVFSGPLAHLDFYTSGLSGTVTSGSYTTMGGTATSPSFTKLKSGTDLRLKLSASCYTTGATARPEFAILINGVDYGPIASLFINPLSTHLQMSGAVSATGIPAGSYTATIRVRRLSGTGVITFNSDDPAWLTIDESW